MAAGILAAITIAFQLFSAAEPLLSLLIQYLVKYYAQHAKALWADSADQNMAVALEAANRIVLQVTNDPVTAKAWVGQMYATYDQLEAKFPGICQSIMARHILMADVPGTSHGMAAKLVEGAHAQVTMMAVEAAKA